MSGCFFSEARCMNWLGLLESYNHIMQKVVRLGVLANNFKEPLEHWLISRKTACTRAVNLCAAHEVKSCC